MLKELHSNQFSEHFIFTVWSLNFLFEMFRHNMIKMECLFVFITSRRAYGLAFASENKVTLFLQRCKFPFLTFSVCKAGLGGQGEAIRIIYESELS